MSLFNQKSQIKGKEKELETVFNRVNDGVFSLDNNWRYTFLNDAAMVVHPFTKKEIIGKFLWEVHPQIRESEFWTNYQEAIKTKEVMEFESYYQPMDKWFSVKVYPSDNGLTIFYRDINEDKKKEKALSQTLKEITDYKFALDQSSIVAITDQKGIITHVNQNFCKISKYSEEELIGQDHRIINSGFHSKAFIKNLWVTIANGKIWKGEMKNKAKDGSFYWVDTTIVPFLNEAGKPYQYVAIRADITERKQTEQALQESEQLLSAIIDNSTAVIYVKNLEGKYLLVNRRFSELFHLDIDAALDKTDYDLFSKEQADAFRRIDVSAAAADHALTVEEIAPHDDGLHTYISVKRVLKDHAGQPYAIFGISTDITEQKKIEHNLRRSLREISDYKFALDESSIVAITDQKGIIKYANQNFCNISKYSVDELMGQDHRIINSGYHTKEFIKNIWVTIANGKIWKGEIKNKAKDRSHYWVDTTIVPFLNDEGKPYQYMAIRADITSRKEIEESLEKTLKEVTDYKYALDESSIVAITDQKGIIKYANHNFCKISKFSYDELIGQDHRIINSGYHPKEFIRNLWTTIANGKIWRGELKNKAKDGTPYWVDTTIIPFLNQEGKPYQYVAIRADITQRKQGEQDIRILNEELEKRVRERTEEIESFSYSVSHDLRAPLRAVHGYARILEEEYKNIFDSEGHRLLGEVQQNAKKMGVLIDDLLSFSRLGRKEVEKSFIDMNKLIEVALKEVYQTYNHPVEIKCGDLHPAIGDYALMLHVMTNLLSNAIKYSSREEKPLIEIQSQKTKGEQIYSISDNGVGFEMEYVHKLFGVFQRLHSNEEFPGTGVGLAIVQRIIHKHNGRIWAAAKPGNGATFYFSLPEIDEL